MVGLVLLLLLLVAAASAQNCSVSPADKVRRVVAAFLAFTPCAAGLSHRLPGRVYQWWLLLAASQPGTWRRRAACFFFLVTSQRTHLTLPWGPPSQNPNNEPWCFRPSNYSPCSPAVQGSSAGNPFSPSDVARMQAFFQANLDLNGTGAVLASPDADVLSGGSYRYHWSRDGALSMRALSETNTNRPMVIAKVRAPKREELQPLPLMRAS